MFFFRSDTSINEEEDNIEILISRLEHSEYLEDKMDALYELEIYADKNILETGTYGLIPLIESIPLLKDISYNLKILHKVFSSVYSEEFVDLLIKNQKTLDILISNRKKDYEGVYNLIRLLISNKEFCKKMIFVKNFAHYCVKQIDFGRLEMVQNMLNLSQDFDKEIVFEGVFEKLISFYKDDSLQIVGLYKDDESLQIISLISKLIKNNHFNQNYFIETDWNKLPINNDTMRIFCDLIDNTNNNINYIKDSVYKYVKFSKVVEIGNYEYIYKMVLDSKKYLNLFFEIYYSGSIFENLINRDISIIDNNKDISIINGIKDISIIDGNKDISIINDNKNNNKDISIIDDNKDISIIDDNKNISIINDESTFSSDIILVWYIINNRILKFKKNGFEYLIYSEILKYYNDKLIEDSKKYTEICKKSEYDIYKRNVEESSHILSQILLLFSFRNVDHSLKILDINKSTILYFIIISNSEDIKDKSGYLIDKIINENTDIILKKYYSFLCILHHIDIKYNKYHKKLLLKEVRRLISEEDIFSEYFILEEATNILLDKINELIIELTS